MSDTSLHNKVTANHAETGTIWAHQGDDDQPEVQTLKTQTTRRHLKPYYRRHKRLHVMLSPADMQRVERLQRRRGWTKVEWVRHCISLDESQRPREAGQYIRSIVPEQICVVAERELTQNAESLMAVADRQSDWTVRQQLHKDAGILMDVAGWFTEKRREYDRIHAQGSGQSTYSTTGGTGGRRPAEHTTASRLVRP